MAYSIQDLKVDLAGVLHGTTTNQITNLDGVIDRSARQLLSDVDPQETKRIVEITGPVFNDVWDYAVPVDLKSNKIIDIRPQVNRQQRDIWLQKYNQAFDVAKQMSWQNQFTIQFNSSIKTIRIDAPDLLPGIILNQAASVQGNGTWVTGGGATNIRVDNQNFVVDGGSVEFDLLAGSPTGYVENSTMSAQNLSNQINQATAFLYTYLPTASAVSAVEFRFGSSAANYYVLSASVTQQNTVFQNGWNLLQYLWSSAAVVGAPNASSITYLRITFSYNSTLQTGVRINNIVSRLGQVMEMEYYSKFMFRDSITNAFQEKVTADSNQINLDTDSYNLLFNLVAYYAVQQQQGLNASFHDGPFFLQQYQQELQRYKALYKSELQKPNQTYYSIPNPSYSNYLGRQWYR